ncbi:hypothetical protein LCGC14_0415860 [marine sediment metagenome]|uniref:Uncharacterized protein n=1 Tax=marine sediment metagenome TaxID=412755 RepID=A0A0F9SSG8_9ZZZZ
MCGKGDDYRKVDRSKYDKNANRIFGEQKLNIWRRDDNGNLIDEEDKGESK